ncbi:MAG TPA: flagellar hook-basal body complex protein FliE [Acetobacteraceae bacterium]|jgi:flagellar hook-basal body complex protein FliE
MSTIPTIVVTPSAAADAYGRVDRGVADGGGSGDFGATLQNVLQGAVDNFHAADARTMEALSGGGNLTDVVTALSRAELTLQTATAVRDRVVQAYQDIMKMPI